MARQMTLTDRIKRGEAAIAAAKAQGRSVPDWEAHLEKLKTAASVGEVDSELRDGLGRILALLICSEILEDHVWVVFDHRFVPEDEHAVYYSDEISALKTKSVAELKEIHTMKLIFPGSRVVQ